MYTGLVILGGKSHDMIYTCRNFNKIPNNPFGMIPVIASSNPLSEVVEQIPFKINIVDIMITNHEINGNKLLICICNAEYTPVITFANPNGFIIGEILFNREFKNLFTDAEKKRITDIMRSL